MVNRSHLVPRQVQDINGIWRTVYVAPDDSAAMPEGSIKVVATPTLTSPPKIGGYEVPADAIQADSMPLSDYLSNHQGKAYTGKASDGRSYVIIPGSEQEPLCDDAYDDNFEGWYGVYTESTDQYGDDAPAFTLGERIYLGDDGFTEIDKDSDLSTIIEFADSWQKAEDQDAEQRAKWIKQAAERSHG